MAARPGPRRWRPPGRLFGGSLKKAFRAASETNAERVLPAEFYGARNF